VRVQTFHLLWTFEHHERIALMTLLDGIGGLRPFVHDNTDLSEVSDKKSTRNGQENLRKLGDHPTWKKLALYHLL